MRDSKETIWRKYTVWRKTLNLMAKVHTLPQKINREKEYWNFEIYAFVKGDDTFWQMHFIVWLDDEIMETLDFTFSRIYYWKTLK